MWSLPSLLISPLKEQPLNDGVHTIKTIRVAAFVFAQEFRDRFETDRHLEVQLAAFLAAVVEK